ncbi:acetyl/propionyl/methylcrotonyl-CoA carboxylase subunit alpha [Neisseriaceae bacterium TC5R-5]|nr:acetyl/propionyl/methylcrotonyl-CoA carboxylase subunit alpha [Neisseriaceae bacterium TC5R-5]
MFKKILIANRGEIACRIIKTARQLGIRTVAVYSDADANAHFVELADEAYRLGPAPATESYLKTDIILQIALNCGAEAIHPGYGFLSENADFATACTRVGLAFIGPPPTAIAAMGSKSAAKALMANAAVPLVPGYHGDNQDSEFLQQQAAQIGYPVLIKASAGGGGKGMRIVERPGDFAAALASCQREARASFGNGQVLLEKYLPHARHIEIQIFADQHNQCVYLFERDCSVQRRHQKVLEEAPAPHLPSNIRQAMGEAACTAARAVGYVGVGTVEFIIELQANNELGAFYFMEMNTRLQVEHPVTEMITGQDLVAWQLLIANGQTLPVGQKRLAIHGHAIEARIYAENPANDFLPTTGRLLHLRSPTESAHVRIDSGVVAGDLISPYYDPLIAKLVVWGETRADALQRLELALADYQIAGLHTNIPFLRRIIQHPSFTSGHVHTGLIPQHQAELLAPQASPSTQQLALLALAEILAQQHSYPVTGGWRLNSELSSQLSFTHQEQLYPLAIRFLAQGFELSVNGEVLSASAQLHGNQLSAHLGEQFLQATVIRDGLLRTLFCNGDSLEVAYHDPCSTVSDEWQDPAHLAAPMPGRIVSLLATVGVKVNKGEPLLILEAMKMEHTIPAPTDGIVKAFYFACGEQVQEGEELIDFEVM